MCPQNYLCYSCLLWLSNVLHEAPTVLCWKAVTVKCAPLVVVHHYRWSFLRITHWYFTNIISSHCQWSQLDHLTSSKQNSWTSTRCMNNICLVRVACLWSIAIVVRAHRDSEMLGTCFHREILPVFMTANASFCIFLLMLWTVGVGGRGLLVLVMGLTVLI